MADAALVTVRLATRAQTRAIPGIEIAAATVFDDEDLPLALRHDTISLDELALAVDENRLWAATTNAGKVVGFAVVATVDGQAYLEEIDVLPAYMRLGIGTELANSAINWAEQCGHTEIRLLTFRHLAWNAPFYAGLGFAEIDTDAMEPELLALLEEEDRLGIDVSKRIAMRKVLNPGA